MVFESPELTPEFKEVLNRVAREVLHLNEPNDNETGPEIESIDEELREIENLIEKKWEEIFDLVEDAKKQLYVPLRLDLTDEEFDAFIEEKNSKNNNTDRC